MKITIANLDDFRAWLLRRGRSDGTADLYITNLRECAKAETLTSRLVGKLAPLTKRTNKAALLAWADFTKDAELRADVKEIRLPPARRMRPKMPLATPDWKRVVRHITDHQGLGEPIKHTCLIIARRGLRVGDALRIRRSEAEQALATGILSFEGKGNKRYEFSASTIKSSLEALCAIPKWKVLRELVTKSSSRNIAERRVRRAFERIADDLDLEHVHPHKLRRTYATTYLEQMKGDPRALIKLQGHMQWASLNTAAMYADSVDRDELAGVGDRMIAELVDS